MNKSHGGCQKSAWIPKKHRSFILLLIERNYVITFLMRISIRLSFLKLKTFDCPHFQWTKPSVLLNLMASTKTPTTVHHFTNVWMAELQRDTVWKEWCSMLYWSHVTHHRAFHAGRQKALKLGNQNPLNRKSNQLTAKEWTRVKVWAWAILRRVGISKV